MPEEQANDNERHCQTTAQTDSVTVLHFRTRTCSALPGLHLANLQIDLSVDAELRSRLSQLEEQFNSLRQDMFGSIYSCCKVYICLAAVLLSARECRALAQDTMRRASSRCHHSLHLCLWLRVFSVTGLTQP